MTENDKAIQKKYQLLYGRNELRIPISLAANHWLLRPEVHHGSQAS